MVNLSCMKQPQDRWTANRSKLVSQIQELEARTSELKEKLSFMDNLDGANDFFRMVPSKAKGLKEAVLESIQQIGTTEWVSAVDVRKHMLASGFKSESKYFPASVMTSLIRLEVQEKVVSKGKERAKRFKVKI